MKTRKASSAPKENFVISVESRFEAAHNLREYYGKPEPLHGHSWKVEVRIGSEKLDEESIGIDYVKVQKALDTLARKLDYTYINRVPPFDKLNPSSENIAKWFHEQLNQSKLLGRSHLQEVVVWEGPFNHVTYRPAG